MESRIPSPQVSFPGQHDNERVLYQFRVHWVHILVLFTATCGLFLLLFAVLYLRSNELVRNFGAHFIPQATEILSYLLLAGVALFIYSYWRARQMVVCITDRRIVRMDRLVPYIERRRALFWRDVAKTKAYSRIPLCALLNVGTLEICARFSPTEGIKIPAVYYYRDLANYIDKIVDTYNTKPDDLGALRPFVPKPAGQRY